MGYKGMGGFIDRFQDILPSVSYGMELFIVITFLIISLWMDLGQSPTQFRLLSV